MTHHKPNFKKEIGDAWKIATLNKPAMNHVAGDKNKQIFAYYFIIAAGLLSLIGMQLFAPFFKPSLGFSLMMAIIHIITTIIGIYVISFVAKKLFKGHAAHDHFFRVAAYGMLVLWLSIFPPLAFIGSIWGLVILVVALKTIHKLSTGGIIGTLLVSLVVMAIISAILSPALGNYGYSGWSKGKIDYKGLKIDKKGSIESEGGKLEFGNGSFKVTNPDGETVEWSIEDKE